MAAPAKKTAAKLTQAKKAAAAKRVAAREAFLQRFGKARRAET
jgi:hypothetical protein